MSLSELINDIYELSDKIRPRIIRSETLNISDKLLILEELEDISDSIEDMLAIEMESKLPALYDRVVSILYETK